MDSYVVRIYRRYGRKSRVLVGTVEVAGSGKRTAFANIDELGAILRRRKSRREREKVEADSGPAVL